MTLDQQEDILINKIKSMKELKQLKEVEDQIYKSEDTLKLISIFQKAQDDYNFQLKFTKNPSSKDLADANNNLNQDPLIKRYNELFKICNEPFIYLQLNLISLFQKRNHISCSE